MGTIWLHVEFRLQEQLFSEHKLCPFRVYNVLQEELWTVSLGRELIGIKNGNYTIPDSQMMKLNTCYNLCVPLNLVNVGDIFFSPKYVPLKILLMSETKLNELFLLIKRNILQYIAIAWTLNPIACFSCLCTDHRKNPHKFMGDVNLV